MGRSVDAIWHDLFLKLVFGLSGIGVGMLGFLLVNTYTKLDRRMEMDRERMDTLTDALAGDIARIEKQADKAVHDSINCSASIETIRQAVQRNDQKISEHLGKLVSLEVYVSELVTLQRERRQHTNGGSSKH